MEDIHIPKRDITVKWYTCRLYATWEQDHDLYNRGLKARGYDLFVSEHTNANDGKTRGVEVFYDYSKPQDKV